MSHVLFVLLHQSVYICHVIICLPLDSSLSLLVDSISEYSGVKRVMYFALLGHYAAAVLVPAFVGFMFWVSIIFILVCFVLVCWCATGRLQDDLASMLISAF